MEDMIPFLCKMLFKYLLSQVLPTSWESKTFSELEMQPLPTTFTGCLVSKSANSHVNENKTTNYAVNILPVFKLTSPLITFIHAILKITVHFG